jgi:hypothetical protein
MKIITKYSDCFGLALALCVMIFSGCSCSAPKLQPDPLAGFHRADETGMDKNKAITDDYKDYIQKLPPAQKGYIGTIFIYENELGEHAIRIEIFEGNQNASWKHVLFYDKDNKRIKVIRYDHVKYQS